MSLPEIPITRRESYYAVMAGQYDTSVLPEHPITREEEYLNAIAHGGGGSTVEVTQIKSSGEKIATITVDDVPTDIYASAGGGGGGAVDTVNGKTGDVVLTASDVGALPDSTSIPAKTSDLSNDSNFVSDASYVHTDYNYDATAKGIVDGVTTALNGKVDKIEGKGLSTNDFTNDDKAAVENAGITASATGTNVAIVDTADARVQDMKIYGASGGIGASGLTVKACGKNLFDINGDVNTIHYGTDPDSYYEETGQYKNSVSNGVLTAGRNNSIEWGCGQLIAVKPNTKYTISATALSFGTGDAAIVRVDCLKNAEHTSAFIRPYLTLNALNDRGSVIIDTGGETLILLCFMARNGRDAQFADIQMEEGETLTGYEPYVGSTLSLTSGLPLRAVGEVKDEIDLAAGTYTKRIDDDGTTVLANPVTAALMASEIAAWHGLRTYESITNITATDDPTMDVGYILNTDNGKALARAQDDADKQIAGKVDKVTGKQLSTEDYTTAEKTKLAGVSAGATTNTVLDLQVTLSENYWEEDIDAEYGTTFEQTPYAAGVRRTDRPYVDLSVSPYVDAGLVEIKEWAKISKVVVVDDTMLRFICYGSSAPTVPLTVNVRVVR